MEDIAQLGISIRSTDVEKASKNLDKMTQAGKQAEKASERLERHWNSLSRMAKRLYDGLGSIVRHLFSFKTLIASIGMGYIAKGFLDTAASFETMTIALKTVTGSMKNAQSAMSWIVDFTAKTPYELEQVGQAFIRMSAQGLNAQKDLKILGDTASAMGKDLMMAVDMYMDAVRGEFERLKEFGAVARVQGDKVRFEWSQGGKRMVLETQKNAEAISGALRTIFSRFEGGMEDQSKSWKGMWSNLKDYYTQFKNDVMSFGPFEAMEQGLQWVLEKIGELKETGRWETIAKQMGMAFLTGVEWSIRALDKLLAIIEAIQSGESPWKMLKDWTFKGFGLDKASDTIDKEVNRFDGAWKSFKSFMDPVKTEIGILISWLNGDSPETATLKSMAENKSNGEDDLWSWLSDALNPGKALDTIEGSVEKTKGNIAKIKAEIAVLIDFISARDATDYGKVDAVVGNSILGKAAEQLAADRQRLEEEDEKNKTVFDRIQDRISNFIEWYDKNKQIAINLDWMGGIEDFNVGNEPIVKVPAGLYAVPVPTYSGAYGDTPIDLSGIRFPIQLPAVLKIEPFPSGSGAYGDVDLGGIKTPIDVPAVLDFKDPKGTAIGSYGSGMGSMLDDLDFKVPIKVEIVPVPQYDTGNLESFLGGDIAKLQDLQAKFTEEQSILTKVVDHMVKYQKKLEELQAKMDDVRQMEAKYYKEGLQHTSAGLQYGAMPVAPNSLRASVLGAGGLFSEQDFNKFVSAQEAELKLEIEEARRTVRAMEKIITEKKQRLEILEKQMIDLVNSLKFGSETNQKNTDAVSEQSPTIDKFNDQISQLMETSRMYAANADTMTDAIYDSSDALQTYSKSAEEAAKSTKELQAKTEDSGISIGDIRGVLAEAIKGIQELKQEMKDWKLGPKKDEFSAPIDQATDAAFEFGQQWNDVWQNMQKTFDVIINDFIQGNRTAAETILDIWKSALSNIIAQKFTDSLKKGIEKVITDVTSDTGIIAKLKNVFSPSQQNGANVPQYDPWTQGAPAGGGPGFYPSTSANPPVRGSFGQSAGFGYMQAGLAAGSALSTMFPQNLGGSFGSGFGGWAQGSLQGASMGSAFGPWGALAGGAVGGLYGGYQSGFFHSPMGTLMDPMTSSIARLFGIGTGEGEEVPHVGTSISGGAWNINREGDQGDVDYPLSLTRAIKKAILDFGTDFSDLFATEFGDVLSNVDWSFESTSTDFQGAVKETLANFIVDNWPELFGTTSFMGVDQIGIPMKGDNNIFMKFQREGETWSDTVIRMMQTLMAWKQTMENIDTAIQDITSEDKSGLRAFRRSIEAIDEQTSTLWDRINEFATESWERLDLTEVEQSAEELIPLIIERYEMEKQYIEELVAQIQSIDKAMYDFHVRIQGKIDDLTGSSDTLGLVVDRLQTLWAEFQSGVEFERAVVILDELETGLDTALSLQVQVHQAEIQRLEAVLAMLEQLKTVSASLTEKILTSTQGFAEQADYYFSQALKTFKEYQGMNWGDPNTLEDRIGAVNDMIKWLDMAVQASASRWEAYWNDKIKGAQDAIDNLQDSKDDIQQDISDLQDLRSEKQKYYQEELEAVQKQIQAAEQWQQIADSVEKQIQGMRFSTDNQQDIFERMFYARGEIARVKGLYAGAGTDEDKMKYAGELQDLYQTLLDLGQEAYQRPSTEYQGLYDEVMQGLQALQSDANLNSQSLESLQAEEIRLTEEMNAALKAIDISITMNEGLLKQIDDGIEGYRNDIEGYEASKQASLDLIQKEAAEYYKYLQGEVDKLLKLEGDMKTDLADEKTALENLYTDFGLYYTALRDAGLLTYDGQRNVYLDALREVVGPGTVNQYLDDLKIETTRKLMDLYKVMEAIAGDMNVIVPELTPYPTVSASFANGGIAWAPMIANVAENEPEVFAPLSDVLSAQSSGNRSAEPSVNISIECPISLNITTNGGETSAEIADTVLDVVRHQCAGIIEDAVMQGLKNGGLRNAVQKAAGGR